MDSRLLVIIAKKGMAKKVIKASKEAGAEGGTVMLGKGTGIREMKKFIGITVEPEKEIVLIIVDIEKQDQVLDAVINAGKLNKAGFGIGFVIDIQKVAGIVHLGCADIVDTSKPLPRGRKMENNISYDLIITIVNKGYSEVVVDASRAAGAEGGTIIFGRGTGIHEKAKLFGIAIEPEKDLVLTMIDRERTEKVLQSIIKEAKLDKPGKGIAFVLGVEKVVGINHELNRMVSEGMADKF